MTHRRTNKDSGRGNPGRFGRLRLVLEPLEARRLLAGIHVSVYVDHNGSRGYEPAADAPASQRLVYIDVDESGSYDRDEPIAVTDDDGEAFFDGLAAGDYSVGLITNFNSQRQVEPAGIASLATEVSTVGGETFLANSDASRVWSVGPSGTATPIVGSTLTTDESVELGGRLVASASQTEDFAWALIELESGEQRLIEFDLSTGYFQSDGIQGLNPDESISGFTVAGSQTFVLLDTPHGSAVGRLHLSESGPVVEQRSTVQASDVGGSPVAQRLAVVGPDGSGGSTVTLLDSQLDELSALNISGVAESIEFSGDGQRLFTSMAGGGIQVIQLENSLLSLAAVLSEATTPIAASSIDGRIVTGGTSDRSELIVWDSNVWLPIGRSKLPSGTELSSRSRLSVDRLGDSVTAFHDSGVHSASLAVASTRRVTVGASPNRSEVRLGVRTQGTNSAPVVSDPGPRTTAEDTVDQFDPQTSAGISDPDGDTLWFTLATPAQHGKIQFAADGSWSYQPDEDYHGPDSAIVAVHDGQSSTELVIEWQVTPVNDPPVAISVDVGTIPEDAQAGSGVGFVSVVDADHDASFRVTTSDPRFTVENGRVYLAGGELDFESEESIVVQVLATDTTDDSIFISTEATLSIGDVNEPPTAVRLETNEVSENVAGATVGTIIVDDPDANSQYEFVVSDPRFVVDGNLLKLVADESVDFESEPEIGLTITARDQSGSNDQIVGTATLSVVNQNDPPKGIVLTRLQVTEYTSGAIVGDVSVTDPDRDMYDYIVSDDRFEVNSGTLKLRDSVELEMATEPSVTLTVTAVGQFTNDRTSATFKIQVVPISTPHQNPLDPHDVNGDGQVTPLDVLILINELNEYGSHPVPPDGGGSGEPPPIRRDVNGDGIISPLDVLIIINELNYRATLRGEGESLVTQPPQSDIAGDDVAGYGVVAFDDAAERRKRETSIDAELEVLLEQLSRERLSED